MSQLGFEGFDDPPKPTDSLFFAIRPDAGTAGRIEALAQQLRRDHGLKGKSLDVARFHITLHALGDFAGVPPDVVAAASAAAATVSMPAFATVLNQASSFQRPSNRPLVLTGDMQDIAGVTALRDAVADALRRTPLGPRIKPAYTPHLTLLYDDHGLEPTPIAPVAWTASEFLLLRSLLGQSRHEVLGRWPLRGAEGSAP